MALGGTYNSTYGVPLTVLVFNIKDGGHIGSFGVLISVSKWPVTRKQLAIEPNGMN